MFFVSISPFVGVLLYACFHGVLNACFFLSFFLERGCIFSFVGGGGDGGLTLFQYVWTFNSCVFV